MTAKVWIHVIQIEDKTKIFRQVVLDTLKDVDGVINNEELRYLRKKALTELRFPTRIGLYDHPFKHQLEKLNDLIRIGHQSDDGRILIGIEETRTIENCSIDPTDQIKSFIERVAEAIENDIAFFKRILERHEQRKPEIKTIATFSFEPTIEPEKKTEPVWLIAGAVIVIGALIILAIN